MKVLNFKELPSTNQKAKDLAVQGIEPWTVIAAEEQTAGYGKPRTRTSSVRGREKAFWFSPKGGLYFSIILPKSKIEDLQTLTILAAFVVAKVIKDNFGIEPLIKLPNDVLLRDKKVCGILTENVIGKDIKLSVIGIGLNTNIDKFPKELDNIVTSLKLKLGKEVDNEEILKQIVEGLKEQLKTISE